MKLCCKSGHQFTKENCYINKHGYTICRVCEKLRSRKRHGYKGNLPTGERTHCPQGHQYTPENTRIYRGSRNCRECHKLTERQKRETFRLQNPLSPKELSAFCGKGHEYNIDNTYYGKDGSRYCKQCSKDYRRSKSKWHHDSDFCRRGHPRIESNIKVSLNGKRRCLTCMKFNARQAYERRNHLDSNYSANDELITRAVFEDKCFKCGSYHDLEIDHHYPASKGFGLSLSNAVLLCRTCNRTKHDDMPIDFYTPNELYRLTEILDNISSGPLVQNFSVLNSVTN